jgi:Recombination endonuclease VII
MERYRDRAAAGLCIECGRRRVGPGRAVCTECRKRRALGRANRRRAGKCDGCGNLALIGVSRCADCLVRGRARQLVERRGISEGQYAEMLARQSGACAICLRPCKTGRRLAVDHDHSTGRIRGLLCFRCNTALARYEEFASAFAAYLAGDNIGIASTL